MKAEELRLGNLVEYQINDTITDRKPYYGENIYGVAMILDDSIKIDLGFGALQRVMLDDPKLKPVLLNEKWLLKYGMEQNQMLSREFNFRKKILTMINHYEDGWLFLIDYWQVGKMIKYVHQFQNLCFVNTGSELQAVE